MEKRLWDVMGAEEGGRLLEEVSPGARWGMVATAEMVFVRAFREACGENRCGRWGTSWGCPPGVGSFEACVARAGQFTRGMVVQTVWEVADCFDMEGMLAAGERHNAVVRALAAALRRRSGGAEMLALGAGGCAACGECGYARGEACGRPERAVHALEGYGVDVGALVERAGLSYHNGEGTVSYVGLVLG